MAVRRYIARVLRHGFGAEARRKGKADEARARRGKFESELWQRGDGTALRRYRSYEDYVIHQSSKLGGILDRLNRNRDEDVAIFTERFRGCAALAEARSVLCLGARIGTEVMAMHDLGHFAVGIDLEPGPENRYVLPGDFHELVFPDGSVDAVYTNALDHAFDLEKLVSEVARVLRPGGIFVADVLAGYEEGFTPGEYEAIHWAKVDPFVENVRALGGFVLEELRDLGSVRRDPWKQAVLRKPA